MQFGNASHDTLKLALIIIIIIVVIVLYFHFRVFFSTFLFRSFTKTHTTNNTMHSMKYNWIFIFETIVMAGRKEKVCRAMSEMVEFVEQEMVA